MSIYVITPRNTTTNNPDDPSKIIDTTSRSSTDWSRGLSPFYLGPVKLYGDYVAQNVENGWQYSKVYEKHADLDQNPTAKYWAWAEAGWANKRAVRYPMGIGAIPLYSWWDGEKLGYVDARKRIYLPLYANAVRDTAAYRRLEEIYKSEPDIWLSAFDSYNLTPGMYTYDELLNNPESKVRTWVCIGDDVGGFAMIKLTAAAQANVDESGTNVDQDIALMRLAIAEGRVFTEIRELTAVCLGGAAEDRVAGWREYVSAVVEAAHAKG